MDMTFASPSFDSFHWPRSFRRPRPVSGGASRINSSASSSPSGASGMNSTRGRISKLRNDRTKGWPHDVQTSRDRSSPTLFDSVAAFVAGFSRAFAAPQR